jgi:NADH:ubiquinone oxidoreductase subunit 4 (subunit M)
LILGIIWLGVYPQPVLSRMEASTTRFVEQVELRAATRTATFDRSGGR